MGPRGLLLVPDPPPKAPTPSTGSTDMGVWKGGGGESQAMPTRLPTRVLLGVRRAPPLQPGPQEGRETLHPDHRQTSYLVQDVTT